MIRLQHVSKVYEGEAGRVAALADVSLAITAGSFVALMGPSGCGKSTLLNLVAGVDTPTAGDVWVGEVNLATMRSGALNAYRRDRVGVVYQFYNLLPGLSAQENVALPGLLTGLPPREAMRRAEGQLARVGLAHRKTHRPDELSGGEMQRVAIARAMMNRPPLLLADEPTGNLDSRAGRRILDLLAQLHAEEGVTVLLATHSVEAAAYAERRIELCDGRVRDEELACRPDR